MPVSSSAMGDVELVEERPRRRVVFLMQDRGIMTLWRSRERGHSYVIGACPGEVSAAVVVDQRTGEQAALIHGQVEPEAFAKKLAIV
ncbi:MAG: hypothetical protein ACRD30_05570, partial [Bryobacteraceae bacterium]